MSDKDWIQTYTGKKFYPCAPRAEDLSIVDMARALSMCCRYAGHVQRFYSVAEHATRLSRRAKKLRLSLEIQKQCLVHDNSEAYLGDVTRPLKIQPEMVGYKKAEGVLQRLIFRWTGLPEDELPEVRALDTEILGTEVAALKQPVHPDWAKTTSTGGLAAPWPGDLTSWGWPPALAEFEYLERFRELWPDWDWGD